MQDNTRAVTWKDLMENLGIKIETPEIPVIFFPKLEKEKMGHPQSLG